MGWVIYINWKGKDEWFSECGSKDSEAEATVFATHEAAETHRDLCGLYKHTEGCWTEIRPSKLLVTYGVFAPLTGPKASKAKPRT